MVGRLFLFFLDFHGFKVLGLKDLAAIQTLHVFDAVSSGDHLRAGMITCGLHNQAIDEIYSNHLAKVVKPPLGQRVTILLMPFPIHRPRRLRSTEAIRNLVRETRLHPGQFILPLFACPGEGVRREIGAMPGNYQMSMDELVKECAEVQSLGIGGVMLFGLPESKDEMASGAYDENGIVQRAIRALKRELPELLVMTDVCNCEYTSHGHCGFIKDGDVDNDTTLQWLAKSALSHARAGA